jgi:hypothetical protein
MLPACLPCWLLQMLLLQMRLVHVTLHVFFVLCCVVLCRAS